MQTSLRASKNTTHKTAKNCPAHVQEPHSMTHWQQHQHLCRHWMRIKGHMPPEQLAANSRHLQLGQPLQPAQHGDAVVLVAEHLYIALACTQETCAVGTNVSKLHAAPARIFATMQYCYLGDPPRPLSCSTVQVPLLCSRMHTCSCPAAPAQP